MKAAIAIDQYKLETFSKALRRAGFSWTRHPGVTADTLILKVPYTNSTFDKLMAVVKATNEVAVSDHRTAGDA